MTPARAGCGPSTPSTAPPTTPTASRCAPPPSPCSATAAPSWASSMPRSWRALPRRRRRRRVVQATAGSLPAPLPSCATPSSPSATTPPAPEPPARTRPSSPPPSASPPASTASGCSAPPLSTWPGSPPGRLDASITFSNKPWDMAAGILLAREAGAAVTDADGTPHTFTSAATIAAARAAHPAAHPAHPGRQQQRRSIGRRPSRPEIPPYADLDAILSRARYLIFDFDGPVRDPATGTPAGYIHEALAACHDSGRIPAITCRRQPQRDSRYLARHGLAELTRHVYTLNGGGSRTRAGSAPSSCASTISALERQPIRLRHHHRHRGHRPGRPRHRTRDHRLRSHTQRRTAAHQRRS